jgi:tungstate transport system permease protein
MEFWLRTLEAVTLILTGDPELWLVTGVSLQVSLVALAFSAVAGLWLGYRLGQGRGRRAAVASWMLHTLTALPTVVVGLTLYFAFSASGPLGWMHLLYTKGAMVIGQFFLSLPIVGALVLTAMSRLPPEASETADTLCLGRFTRMVVLLGEIRGAIVSAALIAFARVFTELGAAIILGGNIRGHTRTLTTVIALEHSKGDDARAIALGIILMVVALGVNAAVHATNSWRGRKTA